MNGKVIAGPSAAFILVLFFLPWLSRSGPDASIAKFNGYQLVTGVQGIFRPDFLYAAFPLIALLTLVLLTITVWRSDFEINASWGQIIAAVAGLVVLTLKWIELRNPVDSGIVIGFLPAWWGTMICLAGITIGAVLDLILLTRRQSQPVAPTIHAAAASPDLNHTMVDEGVALRDSNQTILDTVQEGAQPQIESEWTKGKSQETIVDDPLSGMSLPSAASTEILFPESSDRAAWLVAENGEIQGELIHLLSDTTIGRDSSNDIVLPDTALSGSHLRIRWEDGRLLAYDQNSTNGFFVYSAHLDHWERTMQTELQNGSRIKLGRTIFRLTLAQ